MRESMELGRPGAILRLVVVEILVLPARGKLPAARNDSQARRGAAGGILLSSLCIPLCEGMRQSFRVDQSTTSDSDPLRLSPARPASFACAGTFCAN